MSARGLVEVGVKPMERLMSSHSSDRHYRNRGAHFGNFQGARFDELPFVGSAPLLI